MFFLSIIQYFTHVVIHITYMRFISFAILCWLHSSFAALGLCDLLKLQLHSILVINK
jgi:hypothetical protein